MDTKRNIIDLSKLSPPEKKMIGEILEIREKEVNKVMIPKNEVVALAYDTQLHEAVATYQKYHYSRYIGKKMTFILLQELSKEGIIGQQDQK